MGERRIVMSMSVSAVCLSAASMFPELGLHFQSSPNYLCMFLMAVAPAYSDDKATSHALPILWMTSCLHIMVRNRWRENGVYATHSNSTGTIRHRGLPNCPIKDNTELHEGGVWYLRLRRLLWSSSRTTCAATACWSCGWWRPTWASWQPLRRWPGCGRTTGRTSASLGHSKHLLAGPRTTQEAQAASNADDTLPTAPTQQSHFSRNEQLLSDSVDIVHI